MTSNEELDARLRQIAQSGAPGPSVATSVMDRIERETSAESSRKHIARRYAKWLIPAAAAAVVLLAVGVWPNGAGDTNGHGIVMADVIRRFQSVQTVYVTGKTYRGGEVDSVCRAYLQAPDRLRYEQFLSDGKTPEYPHSLTTGDRSIEWNPATGLYVDARSQPDGAAAGQNASTQIAIYLTIFGLPMDGGHTARVQCLEFSLVEVGVKTYEGRTYARYRVMANTPEGEQPARIELWFDPDTRELCMTYAFAEKFDGTKTTEWYWAITLDPELPERVFEAPEGLIDIEDGIWPRLSPELLEVAEKYYTARESLGRYRAIIVGNKSNWPRIREVRVGNRWRADRLDIIALLENREREDFTGPNQAFDEAWAQIGDPESFLESLPMTHRGGLAYANYTYAEPETTRSHWVQDRTNLAPREAEMHLAQRGWPLWIDDDQLMPIGGWGVGNPPLTYRLLPTDAKRKGLIGIRATEPVAQKEWHEYWIDPARDYLCVSYMRGLFVRHNDAPKPDWRVNGREITEFAQTPTGQWYPRTIAWRMGRVIDGRIVLDPIDAHQIEHVLLDTSENIDERFLEFPASAAPLDEDPPPLSRWRISERRLVPPSLRRRD